MIFSLLSGKFSTLLDFSDLCPSGQTIFLSLIYPPGPLLRTVVFIPERRFQWILSGGFGVFSGVYPKVDAFHRTILHSGLSRFLSEEFPFLPAFFGSEPFWLDFF